ncbi:TetR/AcrR family transcriptional regulator [Streptosporangium sp. NBC_01755]|uniref:TetR/AcrR family transcriptional regulator n=1 Tax=unclassified Streptosporangium TaxID=2632669 RepID=UPI002DD8E3E1|nr:MULTISPECIES: TetR/AcrR family transcriptional regulator [unclassified Streptosporangium]WSA28287.1 TetR/AcrR family transcriptional regulator [Streptosporangium sp. NBC_01810]WSD00236.1 TetR/AcrR family transcriptional regulator [Streptosporangium sp. NBC_01755]
MTTQHPDETEDASLSGQPPQPMDTRDRILQAATRIFAQKGYHGTGMSELGEAAGIQRGALYYHIGSKEDLLFDLCKRHVDEALARGRAAVDSADEPQEQLRRLVHAHLNTLAERRDDVIVAEHEMRSLTGERAVRLRALRREYQNLFEEVFARGTDAGTFHAASPIDVMGVLGMLNYTYVWLDPKGPTSVDEIAERLLTLILNGMAGR